MVWLAVALLSMETAGEADQLAGEGLGQAALVAAPSGPGVEGLSPPPLLAAVMLLTPSVQSAAPAPVSAPTSEVTVAPSVERTEVGGVHHLGVLVDAGIPHGAGLQLAGRPLRWLRLHAGLSSLGAATGYHGGLTVEPFGWPVRPTLTLEAGHMPRGDGTWLFGGTGTGPFSDFIRALAGSLEYGYGSAHLGLDMGSERVVFFLRAGASYLSGQVRVPGASSPTPLNLPLPTGKLGLAVFFL